MIVYFIEIVNVDYTQRTKLAVRFQFKVLLYHLFPGFTGIKSGKLVPVLAFVFLSYFIIFTYCCHYTHFSRIHGFIAFQFAVAVKIDDTPVIQDDRKNKAERFIIVDLFPDSHNEILISLGRYYSAHVQTSVHIFLSESGNFSKTFVHIYDPEVVIDIDLEPHEGLWS